MLSNNDLYPTRGLQERLTERKDPILYGLDYLHKRLSASEILHYEHNGFIIVPDVFSAGEVAFMNRKLAELKKFNTLEKNRYWRKEVPPGEGESLFAPERTSELFRNLAQDKRILDRIQHILGSSVYLHRSRIHIEDGSNENALPWHSEFETWHAEDGVPRMRGAEAWIMLSDNTPASGAMRMLAKSHFIYAACEGHHQSNGSSEQDAYGQATHGAARPSVQTLTRLLYFGRLVDAYGAPGTLVICDSNLMYGSSKNAPGQKQRATVMLSYNSTENAPIDHPFAGGAFRPEPLVNRNQTPLVPRSYDFTQPLFGDFDGRGRKIRPERPQPATHQVLPFRRKSPAATTLRHRA
ncbi:MAG: phytanoyl-CoA dioxygenase family protein [Gammaproteobacteria bacterium]